MLPSKQAAQAHFGCGLAQHRRTAEPISGRPRELQVSLHQRTLLSNVLRHLAPSIASCTVRLLLAISELLVG